MKKLVPLQHRLLIKKLDAQEKSMGGIIIPETAREKPMRGEVLAMGPGEWVKGHLKPMHGIEVGNTVLYSKFCGMEFDLDGEEYFIINYDDILAVVR